MTKVGAGTLKEGGGRVLANAEYATFMALELEAMRPPRKPLPDLSHMTEEQKQGYYFSMQPESTKAAMLRQKDRDPKDDWDYVLRAMPACVANPDAKTKDDLVGIRELGIDELLLVEDIRRKSRNTLGDSKNSSLTEESKQRAIHAYTYSPPAQLTKSDIKSIKKLDELKAIPRIDGDEAPKKSWWAKLWSKLRGEFHWTDADGSIYKHKDK